MVPCQDTPAVKTPYDAEINVPAELTALMSAVPTTTTENTSTKTRSFKFGLFC